MPTESIEYYLYEDLALPLAIVFAICAVAFIFAMVKRPALPKWRLVAFPAGGFCVLYLAAYGVYEIVLPPKPQRDLAMFEELCRTYAKDTINKTVYGVEGLVQMTAYKGESWEWLHAKGKQLQYGVKDPLGRNGAFFDNDAGKPTTNQPYRFLELQLPKDGNVNRYLRSEVTAKGYWGKYIGGKPGRYEEPISRDEYFARLALEYEYLLKANEHQRKYQKPLPMGSVVKGPAIEAEELQKTIQPLPSARYGYSSEDISTRETRFRWIAGGRIQIRDLQTNELLAERVGFFFGQASNGKYPTWSHSPWTRSCPKDARVNWFVLSVLKPSKGD